MSIFRYDSTTTIFTESNKLDVYVNSLLGLRSKGFTSDILRTVHNQSQTNEIKQNAGLICNFAENTAGFLQQAFAGPVEVSFLPLYYAILSLSKIYILLRGKRTELLRNGYHGASFGNKPCQNILNADIALKQGGIIPLFYETITSSKFSGPDLNVKLGELLPYIKGISNEFMVTFSNRFYYRPVLFEVLEQSHDQYSLVITLPSLEDEGKRNPKDLDLNYLQVLNSIDLIKKSKTEYQSKEKLIASSIKEAEEKFCTSINRFLLSPEVNNFGFTDELSAVTPISNHQILMFPEFPILLTFFYLSNIVRYKPEDLFKFKDSKAWGLLLALKTEATISYLNLFLSYLYQTNYVARYI